ncbi:MAG: hypothetical protein ACFCD0_14710 [Gemmataceae bacterium]
MSDSRPIRIQSGNPSAIDSLSAIVPDVMRLEWSEELGQLRRWYDAGVLGQSMNYPAMFWLAFVACEDCVFLAARSPGSGLYLWLEREHGNRYKVEAELNRVHMGDLFTGYPKEPTRDDVIWLARLLKKMWGWKLHHEFSHRDIVISFDEGAEDVLRSYITFYQLPAR